MERALIHQNPSPCEGEGTIAPRAVLAVLGWATHPGVGDSSSEPATRTRKVSYLGFRLSLLWWRLFRGVWLQEAAVLSPVTSVVAGNLVWSVQVALRGEDRVSKPPLCCLGGQEGDAREVQVQMQTESAWLDWSCLCTQHLKRRCAVTGCDQHLHQKAQLLTLGPWAHLVTLGSPPHPSPEGEGQTNVTGDAAVATCSRSAGILSGCAPKSTFKGNLWKALHN